MVTEEERLFLYRVYTEDSEARINLGIRRRLAPLLGRDRCKTELMNKGRLTWRRPDDWWRCVCYRDTAVGAVSSGFRPLLIDGGHDLPPRRLWRRYFCGRIPGLA
jgi:hypothetical protein